ncbi:uncharacterized protein LOC116338259 [Contarinia nasturtii]|uniref:uncharacterized protein LOC116338259 n=1 Tax=Contarinia nasturtii TaxID=265458 RepID=UPI0012D3E26A|nr:uncharacterized protein LOC116338259 [Contarinia nasturtii]
MSSVKTKSSTDKQPPPSSKPPKPINLNLNMKLNRFVYTKYRAMLGSYNDKANEIIQSLPTKKSILQQMDRRFSIGGIKKTSSTPPPPPMLNGSIPTRRITTQPQHEMPSCVQNAMMTKDKKPFTYTPGGIDLSQIKSPRMAQRISRNAQMEGVTNQPKPSPLAQQNTNSPVPAAPSLPPPSTLGMPVQVFPSGPPPPPPLNKSQLNASNGNRSPSMSRKSPQPQSFEPPPLGLRPEIKIPPNPMSNLRKVATPKPKEIDWSEEFRKERSKSPMPGAFASDTSTPQQTVSPDSMHQFNKPTPDKVDSPINTVQQPFIQRQTSLKDSDNTYTDQNNNFSNNNNGNNFNQNTPSSSSPLQRVYSPFASSPQPNLPKPLSPIKLNQTNQDENVPIYVRSSQRATSPKPPTPQPEYGQTQSSPVSSFQRQPSLEQTQTPIYTRSPRNVSASPVKQLNQSSYNQPSNVCASPVKQFNQPTFNQSNQNDSQSENYPIYVRSFQKQQAPPAPQAQQAPQQPLSTAQPFVSEPGRQYYQPNRANNSQQMPPWMRRTNSKELPEWASNNDDFCRPTTAPPQNNQPSNTFSNNNSNYSTNGSTPLYGSNGSSAPTQKERVVPIQFEQTPTKTPSSPGFTAQPYQNTPPQYNRVQPPPFAPTASNYASTYKDPHQFVDQGYNNVQNWDINQHVPPKASDGSRVIPIKLEDGHPYLNGPVSQSPHVIQSGNYRFIIHDCPLAAELQYVKNRLSDIRSTAPNQSKSFRVLQQITDTMKMDPNESAALNKPAELHQPHYSRPLGPNDMNEHQLRKMKLNDDTPKNQPYEARFKQQFPDWVPCKPYSVLQTVMRPDNDARICVFFCTADVQVLNTVQNNHLNSFPNLTNSFSDIPYTVSMPPDTPSLQSVCDDSIAEAIPLRNNDIYESCVYDSYYDKNPPKSRPISTYSDSATVVPRIVITPTPEDNEKRRASWTTYEQADKMAKQNETFEKLTKKLNQIYSNENVEIEDVKTEIVDAKIASTGVESKNVEFKPFGDETQNSNNNQSIVNKSNFTSSKILQHSQELDSSESDSQTEQNDSRTENNDKEMCEIYERKRNDSLYEIEDIRESEIHSDDESADIIEFIIDNSGDAMSNCDTVEFNDHLSVIFEDDEQTQNHRIRLDSICSSNSSATLANDDNGSKHFDSDAEEEDDDSSTVESDTENNTDNESDSDDEDDQSTSVTVRLPLRLSFSRSSNDEEITTVMVGKSEIEIEENVPSYKTAREDSSPDVSVSISLRPKSRPSYSQQSSVYTSKNISFDNENDDDDSEVSVSFSVPIKHQTLSPVPLTHRPAFRRQQTLSPIPHNRDEFEYKRWDRGVSVDRITNIPKSKEQNWTKRNDFIDKHNIKQNISNVTEYNSNHKVDNANVEETASHTTEDNSKKDDSNDIEPENRSVRDKIAAFETIPISRKDEFQRQNACTSFDEPLEQTHIKYNNSLYKKEHEENKGEEDKKYEENNTYNGFNEYNENIFYKEDYAFNQPIYGNSPQSEPQKSMNTYSNYTEYDTRTVTPNYESYVSNEYTSLQSPCQFVKPEFIESQHEHPQQTYMGQTEHTHNLERSENNSEESEDTEKDYKANLSVSQKIAVFEQPAACPPTKIDGQHEISTAREMPTAPETTNKPDSIVNRFLSKVNEIQTQKIETQKSFECKTQKSYEPQMLHSLEMPQSNRNAKLKKMHSEQRSTLDESELEETDSGVDIHRQISEDIDTESECYSELRKLTRYERAQTHSRLFKILQEYESDMSDVEKSKADEEEVMPLYRPKKIVHNVSITRKQNPELAKQAETMAERRERLHLNHNCSSIDTDNPSSSASPSCLSPTPSVNEKLIDELVQSVLKQTKRRNLRNIPIEKIQSAARKAWLQQQEENDSCDTYSSSFDSTPALTPQEFHDDYYDSDADGNIDIFPSKAFKHLQEQSVYGRKNKLWAARCPRVLSSKTVNSDLSRVTETRESQTPERDQQYVYNK